jgi:hypothetical protein
MAHGQRQCATEVRNNFLQYLNESPHDHQQFEEWLSRKMKEKQDQMSMLRRSDQTENVYVVPVVVHIVHNGEAIGVGSNIPDQQIFSQLQVINEDFRRRNTDAINTPEIFRPVAADARIEFILARRAPNGAPTNGIVRVYSPKTSWHYVTDEVELKSLSYWPAEDYINIWVVNQLSGNFIAYSTYPVSNLPGITQPNFNRLLDGVVIGRRYFGSSDQGDFDLDPIYNKGRSLTHELGHYFGLRHIWGDGGCDVDDFCDDTPVAASSYTYCPSGLPSSCGSIDMFQNYMDYTPDRCMNIFSLCQKSRMRTVLENSPRRLSLLTSPGLFPPEEFDLDLAIASIVSPGIVSCDRFIIPEIELVNLGKIVVDQFSLAYQISDVVRDTLTFTNVGLAPGRNFIATLGHISLLNRQYNLSVQIVEVNGGVDYNLANNHLASVFLVNSDRDFIPMVERFNGAGNWDQVPWAVLNENNNLTWELRSGDYGTSNNTVAMINSYTYEAIGERNWLISPALDFSRAEAAGMWFKYSYGYRESRNDMLTIAVSIDCGKTFPYVLFERSGRFLSVVTTTDEWIPQNAGDWINEYLNLNEFAGERDVRMAFIWTNAHGNNIYIDDIEFFANDATSPIVTTLNDFQVFPNPAPSDLVNIAIRVFHRQDIEVRIIDALGRQIKRFDYENILNQILYVPLPHLAKGIYVLRVNGPGINKARRLLIQ